MATSNFHNVNSSKIFAVELEDDYDYEDLVRNLKSELTSNPLYRDGGSDPDELRSFPSTVIGSLEERYDYKDFSIGVRISSIIRSGYYSGCNLDWSIECTLDGYEIEPDDVEDELSYQYDYSESLSKYYSELISRRFENMKDGLVEKLEKIYGDYSTKLGITARFSNGETIYHAIS